MVRRLLTVSRLAALLLLAGLAAGCFPRGPGSRLRHFAEVAPQVGEAAPDFQLTTVDGDVVELAALFGDRPIVLQLGSHSCPVYRYRQSWMDDLWEQYRDRVHFLVVYTREAHPVGSKSPYADGEWDVLLNRIVGVRVEEPADFAERADLASRSKDDLGIAVPVLVDSMQNDVWQRWGAASSPAFVIDRHGTVRSSQVWIQPAEIRRVLEELLTESASASE